MKKEWFKSWFNSEYYNKAYMHRDEKDANLICNLILNNISLNCNSKILDAACGNGRHFLIFSEKGYKVFGFDLSKNLLNVAKEKIIQKKLPLNLFCADIRNIYLKEKFDLIVNLFTSFGYFEDDEENFQFIKNAYKLLMKDGFYVLDYFNVNYIQKKLVNNSEKLFENFVIHEERSIVNDRVEKKIKIKKLNDALDINNEIIFYESVKMYDPTELIKTITSFGFKVKNMFGSYNGEFFNENNSPRLILFFQK